MVDALWICNITIDRCATPISGVCHIQREASALLVLQRWAIPEPLSVERATSTVSRLNQNKIYNSLIFSNILTETL